jgi:hypothetical protein
VTSYFESKANGYLEAQLDRGHYDESDLLAIKIPANEKLPYVSSSIQFQRVDGEIEIKGVFYKYCKLRLYNDSLELLCVPNQAAMNIRSCQEDFFRSINDLQHDGQSKKTESTPPVYKNFQLDAFALFDLFKMEAPFFRSSGYGTSFSDFLSSPDLLAADHPPEASFA